MIQQLDLLLEDGHLLEKEITKAELRQMQSDYLNNRNSIQFEMRGKADSLAYVLQLAANL